MANEFAGPESMVFVFLAVGAVALFSMIAIVNWSDARRKLMREEARISTLRTKQGLQIGGLITGAAGLGVLIFLRVLLGREQGVYLCGLIPLFVGMALFASSYLVKTATD